MMLDYQVYADGAVTDAGEDAEGARRVREDGDFVWIRMFDPTPTELRHLAASYDLPELAVEDALQAHQRPKLERYDSGGFMVLKPAVYDDDEEEISLGEIDVFWGPTYVITVRHGAVGRLSTVTRRLSTDPELAGLGPMAVVYAVADSVVDAYAPVVRELERDIDQIERDVFDDAAQPPTERIYALIREVLDFQRATASLLLPLEDLAAGRVRGVVPELAHAFRDVADHARLVQERSQGFSELLNGALQANLALIGLQENRDQRKISAWAAIALVPTIIGGIWGMNVPSLPLGETDVGFPVLITIMAGVSGYLYWRLRRNSWL